MPTNPPQTKLTPAQVEALGGMMSGFFGAPVGAPAVLKKKKKGQLADKAVAAAAGRTVGPPTAPRNGLLGGY